MLKIVTSNSRGGSVGKLSLVLPLLAAIAMSASNIAAAQSQNTQLILKLKPNADVRIESGRLFSATEPEKGGKKPPGEASRSMTQLNELIGQPLVTHVRPLFTGGGGGRPEGNLERYYAIQLKVGTSAQEAERLRAQLASQDLIEQAYFAPIPEDPGVSSGSGGRK